MSTTPPPPPPIRTFLFTPDDVPSTTPPLLLSLSRRTTSWFLTHPIPLSPSSPNERQHTIINALLQSDPFPPLSNSGNPCIWLKVGAGKAGEPGGENQTLLEQLVEGGVVKETGRVEKQGMIEYPLVEVLIPGAELCNVCEGCGRFESLRKEGGEVQERFRRCARCKEAFYCSTLCQNKHWKTSHKANCLDLASDDDAAIEEAKRRTLLRLFGRTVKAQSGPRSKMD